MKNIYSTTEAKAKFSEVLESVRKGETITVTYRGKAVAVIRPVSEEPAESAPKKKQTAEERLEEMRREGTLGPARGPRKPFKPVAHWQGAVEWLLSERDE